MSQRRILAGTW